MRIHHVAAGEKYMVDKSVGLRIYWSYVRTLQCAVKSDLGLLKFLPFDQC